MRMPEKERYQYLRERKRCACCGKQDERTLGGFAYCDPCAEKARKRYNADKHKELNKQKRIENFANGVCTKCGKQKPSEDTASATGAVSMPPIHTAADVRRTVGVPDKTKKHAADEVSDYVLPKGIYGKPVLIL